MAPEAGHGGSCENCEKIIPVGIAVGFGVGATEGIGVGGGDVEKVGGGVCVVLGTGVGLAVGSGVGELSTQSVLTKVPAWACMPIEGMH